MDQAAMERVVAAQSGAQQLGARPPGVARRATACFVVEPGMALVLPSMVDQPALHWAQQASPLDWAVALGPVG